MIRILLVFGAALALGAACRHAAAPAGGPASGPPAVKLPGENDLTRVRLTADAARRLGITTAPVARRPLRPNHALPAQTMLPPGALTTVQAPIAGRIALVEDGSPTAGLRLAAGAAVLRLVPVPSADLRSNLVVLAEAARGRVARATAEAAIAELAVQRARQLLAERAGSQRAVDEAEAALAIAQAGRSAATAELRALTEQIDVVDAPTGELTVRVDRAAVITAVHALPGQLVPAGAPLFDVEDRAELWLRVDIPLALDARLATDEPVRFGPLTMRDLDAPEIAQPTPQPQRADPLTTSVARFYAFDNTDGHRGPGERVLATIAERAAAERLTVPRSAVLFDAGGGTWVYENLGEHEFRRRRIDVAFVLDEQVAFDRGPEVGSRVVVAGAAELFGTEFGAGK